jgi:dolichol-phosphate mannosyltransferase
MSGFFMLRREAFWPAARRLTGIGFKILLDILASSPRPLTVAEVPYTFRPRHAGASKLDLLVVTEYGLLLEDKLIGRWVPLRFAAFVSVGGLGVALHLAALAAGCFALGASFAIAQAAASALAMVLNYFFNNLFTYSDRRRRGAALWTGLAKFVFICALGLTLNVLVAAHLHELGATWWLAGLLGAAVGALWNFGVSAQFVWRTRNAPFASNNGEPKNI